jgi:1,4-dihydroxy-2-naphthoate polyprenyltransferase
MPEPLQHDESRPTGVALWWEAARPRTLPASVAPVLVGTCVAERVAVDGLAPLWGRAVLALLVALSLQVAVNYANDYFDGVRGVDTEVRVGPRRITAAGLATPATASATRMARRICAGVAGSALALLASPWLLLVGVAAGLATLGYSGGPKPYASAGLGELSVFVFFGLVATSGSQFVQDGRFTAAGVVAGAAMGAWSVALLLVNNLRDIETDEAVGKRTLAVRIGERATRRLAAACLALPAALTVVVAALVPSQPALLGVLAVAAAGPALRIVRTAPVGPKLIAALGTTGRAQLVHAVLLSAGLVLGGQVGA